MILLFYNKTEEVAVEGEEEDDQTAIINLVDLRKLPNLLTQI